MNPHPSHPLDTQLAGLVNRILNPAPPELLFAVRLTVHALEEGHTCVDLEALATASSASPQMPTWPDWLAVLTSPQVQPIVGSPEQPNGLFILSGSRLYLRRYWAYERQVESRIQQLVHAFEPIEIPETLLAKYFPDDPAHPVTVAQQRQAARNALSQGLTLLSGGPGTGKTYTLARIVVLLAEFYQAQNQPFLVKIAAPTGKAAQRILESLQAASQQLQTLGIPQSLLQSIPQEATTLHRLLGPKYNSPYFLHHAQNPLVANLVVIDESSMIDVPLMAKFLSALSPTTRLLLVGDANQLASVEPGHLYGDLCHAADSGGPLQGCLTTLSESRRFPSHSELGQIASAIHATPSDAWEVLLHQNTTQQTFACFPPEESLDEAGAFAEWVQTHLRCYLQTQDPAEALHHISHFRVLCALRKGPYGVNQMNERIARILTPLGLKPFSTYYDHRLVLITQNTPNLNLYNGDIAVILHERDANQNPTGKYLAWTLNTAGLPRAIPASLLPQHETAFAMTIHKSQGSEFNHLALIIPPDTTSPLLTRELLYTGLTRIKIAPSDGFLRLYCSQPAFETAVAHPTLRTTGLFSHEQPPSNQSLLGEIEPGKNLE